MNTNATISLKIDKKLNADAQKVAAGLGVPLNNVMNAFLKQFVHDKKITFSVHTHRSTAYVEQIIESARKE